MRRAMLAALLLCCGGLACAAAFAPAYLLTLGFLAFLYITLALSWDLVGGRLGYMNLGHVTFFGVGAYGAALLLEAGVSFAAASGLAALASAVAAGLLGHPLLRLRGAYFALATLGLPGLMEVLTRNLRGLTGGSGGLSTPPGDHTATGYLAALALAAATAAATGLLCRTRFGLGLAAIREDEEAAGAFGVPVARYKWTAFVLSSVPAGLAGAIYAWTLTYVSPSSVFGLEVALTPVVMALLGGAGTLAGPCLGALLLTLLQELLWTRVAHFHLTLYGGALILLGLYLPGGLVRLPWARLSPVRSGRGDLPAATEEP